MNSFYNNYYKHYIPYIPRNPQNNFNNNINKENLSNNIEENKNAKKTSRYTSFGPLNFKNPLFCDIEEPIFEIFGIELCSEGELTEFDSAMWYFSDMK